MDPYGAFGAAKAVTPFDPIAFIKNPQVILRIICCVFAIVVFGCISSQGWYEGICQYNGSSSHCRFGSFIGVVALLTCSIFIFLDARFDNLVSVKDRKHVVLADLGFSGLWTIVWFLCFCSLSNAWRKTPISKLPPQNFGRNNVQGAIAFSLFSTILWSCLTFLAYRRYRIGVSQTFATTNMLQPTDLSYSAEPSGTGIVLGSVIPSPFGSSQPNYGIPQRQKSNPIPFTASSSVSPPMVGVGHSSPPPIHQPNMLPSGPTSHYQPPLY